MTLHWRNRANFLVDQAERRGEKLTKTALAAALGKNRTTLWRDEKRQPSQRRKAAEQRANEDSGKPKRRTAAQAKLALKVENAQLKRDKERLLQNFIVVCRRLHDLGIKPETVLGELTPERGKTEWQRAILPWRDI